jgi:hypothetical protein
MSDFSDYHAARFEVPLDDTYPSAGTIRLWIHRLPADDPAHGIGMLLVNLVGPGAPGSELAGQVD